ncbi:family 78 glycoside hydrolase catalytic domain [Actinoallomurus rhizosphaericola]|uniref:family 78 glycoside hydrolase catalytic domain n=1 Tax=Actinoallomurus rhizosphaericola TaxID=2952536 RepID=UPI002092B02B|nr:family 78 glycoside hydrolase catalytic domain [Actinoallomurus rhizosphaericola]MCO5997276.1 family 78 glycoside hydrolase catalytic domain [Actinoallomurus rhizosphaericola]
MTITAHMRGMPRLLVPVALALAAVLAPGAPARADAARLGATGLRTDALATALGIDDATPTLSWRLTAPGHDEAQAAYQVQAASTRDGLDHPDLWDSGRVAATSASAVYRGAALKSRERVWWRVRVWDAAGRVSAWSDPAWWEMGLTAKDDWSAKWIGDDRWVNRKPTPVTVKVPAQDARYVRVDVTKLGLPIVEGGSLLSRLQLAEIVVADSAHPDADLAEGATATASDVRSYPGKWEPEYLTDGSLSTEQAPFGYTSNAYKSQDPGHDIWVQLDLGQTRHFDQVVLYPRTDTMTDDGKTPNFPVDFTVQTGDDTANLRTVTTVTGQEPPPAYHTDFPPLPILAKQFDLGKDVRDARLYITALGLYDATINGRPVSDAVLEPPNTDYRKRVVYSTYDVTRLLRTGGNAIGVRLGNGTYNVAPTADRYTKYVGAQGAPRLLAQLEVTLKDGTTQRIATDASWRSDLGPTTFSQWYGGEDEDARRDRPGWDAPGADLSGWRPAVETADPGIAVAARTSPPIVPVGREHTVAITHPESGTYVFDMGANVSGWPVLHVSGPRGTTLTIKPGERLGDDGLVDQGTMIAGGDRQPPVEDHYTLAGGGTQTWHPRFVYHGFRYLQVTGLPSAPTTGDAEAIVLRADNAAAGTFSSSDLLLNDIHKITQASIAGNMFSILTDCPDREKLGWLEQTHLVQGSVARDFDVEAYYRDFLQNVAEAQLPDGHVPDIAPEYVVFSGSARDDPNWGSAIIMAAWQHYQSYGDVGTLRTYFPAMGRYFDYLTSKASGSLLNYGYGDWAGTDSSTPVGIAASYGYYRDAVALGKIARLLGEDPSKYDSAAGKIAAAFNTKYLKDGTYGSGSQAGDAFALDMGVVPADQRQAVTDHLVTSIEDKGYHLTVGEIALPAVFRVLSAAGRDDVLLRIAQQVTAPSYGYQVVHGATTLTEYWDGPTGYGSQDHFMLGAIDEWFNAGLAGIRQADGGAGFTDLVIRPAVVGDLTSASGTYETPRGQVASSWRREGGTLHLDVTVPPGAPARVEVPLLGGDHVTATPGAKWVGVQNGHGVYEVGSGHWSFTAVTASSATQDRQQLAVEPPFGVNVPVLPGSATSAKFRVTNLEDRAVTVRPGVSASAGFTASVSGGPVRVPAHGSVQIPVTLKQDDTGVSSGTVTLKAGDDGASAPVALTSNLVRAATMSASSTHSGSAPAWANDGGTDSEVWLNGVGGWNDDTAGEFPDTLTATWNAPVTLGRVRVLTLDSAKSSAAKSGIRDFDLEVRTGDTWRTVATVSGNTAGTVERTFDPVQASALRVVVHDSNDHKYSRVIELEGYAS